MFTIVIQSREPVVTVTLTGRFDIEASLHFQGEMKALLEQEAYILLDLGGCTYLSSSGIRTLMTATRRLAARGGCLLLAGATPGVLQVLEITGMDKVFNLHGTLTEAIDEVSRLKKKETLPIRVDAGGFGFRFQRFGNQEPEVSEWRVPAIAGYDELGFSVGWGSPAESEDEDTGSRGWFVTLGTCAGFLPSDRRLSPDFRVVRNAAEGVVFVHRALSFGHHPGSMAVLLDGEPVECDALVRAAVQLSQNAGCGNPAALVMADHHPSGPSLTMVIPDMDENILSGIAGFLQPGDANAGFLRDTAPAGIQFMLESLPSPEPEDTLTGFLHRVLTFGNITEVKPAGFTGKLVAPEIWLFPSGVRVDAESRRILVDAGNTPDFEPYKACLARRLYGDSARVAVKPLHGGYSAQTFQVDSFDAAGRKLRPTVLKIASRALIAREADRCRQYAMPYILNNSAMILGTAFLGDTGALRYNFVGIGGEQTRLKWLTHYYNSWPPDKLTPLFDKIFTQILKPWYGQPVWETIYPFRDHDPTLTFFPRLCETAGEILGIRSGEPTLEVAETGQKLVNPYWYLKHEFRQCREETLEYFTSVCHGDLNMQNILLDDDLNVYLIDFSETRPRSVVSDFARLEAIFMVERAPLESDRDLKEMTEFVARFYGGGRLDTLPGEFPDGANREIMERNVAMTLKMRQYAMECTKGNSYPVPYYMALLEWVLPVVCYGGVPLLHKKLSAYLAGLLCSQIMHRHREEHGRCGDCFTG